MLSLGADTHPVYFSIYAKTPWLLTDTANADDGVVVVVSDAPHAIVNSEAALQIWVTGVRSLVDEYTHERSGLTVDFAD